MLTSEWLRINNLGKLLYYIGKHTTILAKLENWSSVFQAFLREAVSIDSRLITQVEDTSGDACCSIA
jgi:hypothetical protein